MSDAPSQLVADRYRLISPLGQGGMGRVWKARDEVLHRDVAIKELVPPPGLTADERREMRERSLREARAIARLNHINVVRIFDVLRTDGDPWIVMEYVASKSLQDTLAEDGPVPPARGVEIGLGVLGALKAAHKAGVMHRDVKPGNVLLGDDGRVVLTDFGLATIPGDPNVTRTGLVLGSPAYIAPERARDGTAGPEADLWSLGATLYAAVEGKSPYARPSAIATLAALATEPLPPPRNAGPLKPVLQGLLRKDPKERITAEVAERLLRRAAGKRAKTISLLDGVRRPGPNGPREPRPPLVPAPRPGGKAAEPTPKPNPPAPRTAKGAAGAAAAAVGKAATDSGKTATDSGRAGSDSGKTAQESGKAATDSGQTGSDSGHTGSDAGTAGPEDATAKVPATSDAAPTAKVDPPEPAAEPTVEAEAPAPGNPTAVLATPVSPAPPVARDPGPVYDGTKRGQRKRNLLLGAAVLVLLLGLAGLVPVLTSGDKPEGAPTGTATSSAAPAPTSAAAPPPATSAAPSPTPTVSPSSSPSTDPNALPAGWTLHRGPTFAIPLPPGWQVGRKDRDYVVFFQRNSVRELLVQWTSNPKRDAEADWRSQEPNRKNLVRNYQYIDIKSCAWYRTCADWEWRETRDNTRIRVRNRGFATASNRGYAIRWEVADRDWQAELATFDQIVKGFRPDRVN
ncbi:serine/threonine protein kinase [Micromonospora sp. KC606]|uniref:serine/threonine-protein kinase n=1 Tax=Micromonospora sp. KC606 TaxID=2530379 RepID=UPI0010446C47|nr:serine/threonine-protein kinase [Micromonospora sp. KC606]TDC82988.1 serine/threonine protein kinase [Micromonospora sp. KC606]